MPLDGVLFDFDGTLVDSEPLHYRIWRQIVAELGFALSEQDYRQQLLGRASDQSAAWLIQRWQLPFTPAALLDTRQRRLRQQLAESPPPLLPYARETLDGLRALGLRLALVSGSHGRDVATTLASHGLAAYFETVCTGDLVPRNKPHPDSYQLALRRLGLAPERCVALEDSRTGIQAASAAGLRCLGVRNPYSGADDFHQAHRTFDDLGAAQRWLSDAASAPD